MKDNIIEHIAQILLLIGILLTIFSNGLLYIPGILIMIVAVLLALWHTLRVK